MIPKKLYLNYVNDSDFDNDVEITWSETPVYVSDCKMQNREYTDLSQVWHDADEMPDYGSAYIAINNNNNICDCCRESLFVSETVWANIVSARSIKKWIYIADILPKGGTQ